MSFSKIYKKLVGKDGLVADVLQNPTTLTNELLVNLEGHVSEENSTITNLPIDEAFTGEWADTVNFGVVTISILTDQDSALDGLVVQWSPNQTDIINVDSFQVLADVPKTFTFGPASRYMRMFYTNGSIAQTSVNIQTMFRRVYVKPSSHRISDSIIGDDDAELVKSLITGLEFDTGIFHNVGVHKYVDDEYFLSTASIQSIFVDANNTNNLNLTSENSYTFAGAATSTIGVNSIRWTLNTDKNATVYVEQSIDGVNWDISDSFDYYYINGGDGGSIKTVAQSYRMRVVLTGTEDTTSFRLECALTPISEPLPRALDTKGRLKVGSNIEDAETGVHVDVEPLGSLKTITPVLLAGTGFGGSTKDTNFWSEAVTGSGTVTQAGQIIIATGITPNSTSAYTSVRKGRKSPGSTNQFRAVAGLTTEPQANNIRRIGCYDAQDGFFFQVNGLIFGVGSRKGGVDTIVSSGSFNGNLGNTFSPELSLLRLVIDYNAVSAKFFINGVLLHTIYSLSAFPTTNSLTLPAKMENINSGGNTTNNTFTVRFASILRLGPLLTSGNYKYMGANGTYILKYGAGTLQTIVNTDNAGTVIAYDNITAAAPIISSIDTAKALGTLGFSAPFNTGLTIVVGGGAKITVVYE